VTSCDRRPSTPKYAGARSASCRPLRDPNSGVPDQPHQLRASRHSPAPAARIGSFGPLVRCASGQPKDPKPPRRVGVAFVHGNRNLHPADNWLTTIPSQKPNVVPTLVRLLVSRFRAPSLADRFLPRFDHFPGIRLFLGQAEPPASGRFFGLAVQATASRGTSAAVAEVVLVRRDEALRAEGAGAFRPLNQATPPQEVSS